MGKKNTETAPCSSRPAWRADTTCLLTVALASIAWLRGCLHREVTPHYSLESSHEVQPHSKEENSVQSEGGLSGNCGHPLKPSRESSLGRGAVRLCDYPVCLRLCPLIRTPSVGRGRDRLVAFPLLHSSLMSCSLANKMQPKGSSEVELWRWGDKQTPGPDTARVSGLVRSVFAHRGGGGGVRPPEAWALVHGGCRPRY